MAVEEQITELRSQIADLQERLSHLEQEWQGIPDLIEARLKLTDSRTAALSSDMAGVKRTLGELRGEVQALPRILADMLAERKG
jgi:predicted  nucleic acid-binding Zn-ribbon protein